MSHKLNPMCEKLYRSSGNFTAGEQPGMGVEVEAIPSEHGQASQPRLEGILAVGAVIGVGLSPPVMWLIANAAGVFRG